MRFDTQPHQLYGGLDRHARSLDVGLLTQEGASVVHCHLPTHPEALLKTIAPDRAQAVDTRPAHHWPG